MERDLTKGNIVFTLAGFSLPLILSGVLQQLYNWADAFIVGNIEGELALAAVGATGTITNLFVMVITGLTLGLSILAAQKYGRGERESLRRILSTFSIVLGVLFLLTAAAGLWLSDGILRLLHTPEDIFDISEGYLRIILTGIPFITIYNVYSAVLRGLGDSRAPFLSVLVSAAANVILDLAFVGGLRMGAPGAAAATVISQALMTVFIVCYAGRKYEILRFSREEKLVDKKILVQGFQLGLPPAIQSSVNSCGNLLLQNFMNSFGTQTVAAITTAYRVDSILLLPIINLGSGISTVTAQNMGAGNRARAKKVLFAGSVMMLCVSICLTFLILSAGGPLIALFGVTEESTAIGASFFRSIAGFYTVYGFAMAFRGFLEGCGDVLYSSIAGIAALASRILISYLCVSVWGNMVIAYAEGITWILLLALYLVRFLWKQRKPCGRREETER